MSTQFTDKTTQRKSSCVAMAKAVARVCARIFISTILVGAFFVAWQDFLIFPGLYGSFWKHVDAPAPSDVREIVISSQDGRPIWVWRVEGKPVDHPPPTMILFHGNGDTLASFVNVQRWLAEFGVTSFAVEYRGFHGRGAGWPTLKRLEMDAKAVWDYVVTSEQQEAESIGVMGVSIGTGVASWLASEKGAGVLVLLSPYADFLDLVGEQPGIGLLRPFVWYDFPVARHVSALPHTSCIVVAHGRNDQVISFQHSERLVARMKESQARFTFIDVPEARHNDLLGKAHKQIESAIVNCSTGART